MSPGSLHPDSRLLPWQLIPIGEAVPRAPAVCGKDVGTEKGKLENQLNSLCLCLGSGTPDTPPKYTVVFS